MTTTDWQLYEDGKKFLRKIGHYEVCNKNERFYTGDQWNGVVSNGLPTPVFNFIKRVIDYKISSVMQNDLSFNFSPQGVDTSLEAGLAEFSQLLKDYAKTTWENVKMQDMNGRGLLDAANTGTMISYWYFEPNIETGQMLKGDICGELIDSVNYLPGNPNDPRINSKSGPVQPYILIAYRMLVQTAKDIARANGVSEEEIQRIAGDTDNQDQSGDMAKNELDTMSDNGKVTVLLKLWKNVDTGTIWFRKSAKDVILQPERDTGMRLYPVALMNWYERKNSAYGTAETTGLIPNQIYVNKIAAMIQLATMYSSFPKLLYNKGLIQAPSNQIGTAIGVDGDITNAAKYLIPGQISGDAFKMFESTLATTKDLMGASDAALGEINPDNTSAIIAVQEAAAVPLENIKRRFWQYIEDVGRIWMEMWVTYFAGERMVSVKVDGQDVMVPFDPSMYRQYVWSETVDVGPSTQFSEVTAINTLDKLLTGGNIDIIDYLERIPDSVMPKKKELLESKKQLLQAQAEAEAQMQAEMGGVNNVGQQ